MKYLILAPLLSTLLLGAAPDSRAALPPATEAAPADVNSYSARVIVRFKVAAPSVRAKIMAAQASRFAVQDIAQTRATGLGMRTGVNKGVVSLKAHRSLDERTHVFTAKGMDSAALVKRLALDSEVEMVVIDQRRRHTAVTPNDPLFAGFGGIAPTAGNGSANGQWYLKAPAGEVVSSINAPTAWDRTTGNASVVVAVLDTGVRKDHPDLAGQFVGGYDMINNAATAGDGGLRDDDASDPGDYVTQADINGGTLGTGCDASDIGNSSWHGTRVSGLIAASSNNGQGIAGVAWGVRILPIRVLGKCGGFDSDIMAGMKWAAGIAVPGVPTNPNPAKVLNLSLGGTGTCTATGSGTYRDTINQVIATGATIVVAAGNSAGQAVGLPGNCPGVIAVTGLRHVGSKVGFSSVGPEVSIAAPGGNCVNLTGACLYPMLSTTNSGTTTPVTADASYTNNSASVGTSFSAPIVAGTVALMLSAKPALSSTEVLSILQRTARPFVSTGATAGTAQCVAPTASEQLECYCTTSTCGAGMLDASAAVAAAVAGIAQTITFAGLSNQVYGASTALVATASSGLAVSFASATPAVCTVSANTVSLLATGTCTITASQAGNASYAAASPLSRSFDVLRAAQTISFTGPADQVLGTAPPALTATASSGLAVGFASTTASVCSVSGSSLSLLLAGTCTITASQAGDGNFTAAASVSRSFAVAAAPTPIPTPTPTPVAESGGGGGGAFSSLWVAMLGFSTWLLRRPLRVPAESALAR
ncbi:S8 family peptidase [Roseateles oligotrophus]|uniref:S8 family peptidase n=1 Tax=Roseateles oligotrophus TaxID=1769250 RepID=A0ABT2YJY8_9BURK|nr:S8 family peptidase [Roseateles oligotrophus]MCV2370369.1 S8 family peptidase [Roseateles oligotrophus]